MQKNDWLHAAWVLSVDELFQSALRHLGSDEYLGDDETIERIVTLAATEHIDDDGGEVTQSRGYLGTGGWESCTANPSVTTYSRWIFRCPEVL